jgi:hypothetical protein
MSQFSNHEMHADRVRVPETDTLLRMIRAWATARFGTEAVELRIDLDNGGAFIAPIPAGNVTLVPARRIG